MSHIQVVVLLRADFVFGEGSYIGTCERERPCFQMVPIWEPRFLYSSHSGVACHPSADA